MAKLRKMLTHPRKNESGQGALAIVLILLMLGAIILTPLLVFMNTGLKAGGVYESKMQEFYAADAGVEDAIWEIKNESFVSNYTLADKVNDRDVNVTIGNVSGGGYSGYKIISTATSDTGGNTTIVCYYGALNFSGLFDNAISSDNKVDLKNKVNVTGNVSTPGCVYAGYTSCGCPNCTYSADCPNCTKCCSQEPLSWPNASDLSAYYWDKVRDLDPLDPYYGGDIELNGNDITIKPLYRYGDLSISNSKGQNNPTATLNGTVYVTGNLDIPQGKDFTLNLSNQTIYCEGNITMPPKAVNITGSGCIIAVGDILFQPKSIGGSNDTFVFILSVNGTVTVKPSGTFYGAIAGKNTVMEYGGENPSITWTGLNNTGVLVFPTGKANMKVLSYTIK